MSEVRQHKYVLDESEMPTTWYNLVPDLPSPPPPALHPGTLQPAGPEDFAPLFPMDLILQEVSQDRFIDIPGPVLDVYRQWRPSPLFRAHRLEEALGTPARIYYKYEGVSPAGSHKPNTAVPQAYYNKLAGVKKLTTETGAGQWGTALSFACALFGLECEVWQVGSSYDAKPYRRLMMEVFGGKVHRSPSDLTEAGRRLGADPKNWSGSLGIAISEAVEVAATNDDVRYALGSVLNHVLMHQTIIGEEAILQLAKAGDHRDGVMTGGTIRNPGRDMGSGAIHRETQRPAIPHHTGRTAQVRTGNRHGAAGITRGSDRTNRRWCYCKGVTGGGNPPRVGHREAVTTGGIRRNGDHNVTAINNK